MWKQRVTRRTEDAAARILNASFLTSSGEHSARLSVEADGEGSSVTTAIIANELHRQRERRKTALIGVPMFLLLLTAPVGQLIRPYPVAASLSIVAAVVVVGLIMRWMLRMGASSLTYPDATMSRIERAALANGWTLTTRSSGGEYPKTVRRRCVLLLLGLYSGAIAGDLASHFIGHTPFPSIPTFVLILITPVMLPFLLVLLRWSKKAAVAGRGYERQLAAVHSVILIQVIWFTLPVVIKMFIDGFEEQLATSFFVRSHTRAVVAIACEIIVACALCFGAMRVTAILVRRALLTWRRTVKPVWAGAGHQLMLPGSRQIIIASILSFLLIWFLLRSSHADLRSIMEQRQLGGYLLPVIDKSVEDMFWSEALIHDIFVFVICAIPSALVIGHIAIQVWNRRQVLFETGPSDATCEHIVDEVVRFACRTRKLSRPRIIVDDSTAIRVATVSTIAFRRPGWIRVSEGALRHLSVVELEAVLAHEIGHLAYHRRMLAVLDVLSVILMCGFGGLTGLADWNRLESDADRFAADYLLNKYGRCDALVAALRKIEAVNVGVGARSADRRVLGFSPVNQTEPSRRKRRDWMGRLRWMAWVMFRSGFVGYVHGDRIARERFIAEYSTMKARSMT